jgi:hypothetical protein
VGAGSCAHAPVPHQLQAQDHLHLQPRRTEEPLHRQASRQVTSVVRSGTRINHSGSEQLQIRKMNFK